MAWDCKSYEFRTPIVGKPAVVDFHPSGLKGGAVMPIPLEMRNGRRPRTAKLLPAAALAVGFVLVPSAASSTAAPVDEATADPAALCKQERASIGRKAMKRRYGKSPMRKCMTRIRKAASSQSNLTESAAAECSVELADLGPLAFAALYGTPGDTEQAYSDCTFEYIVNTVVGLELGLDGE